MRKPIYDPLSKHLDRNSRIEVKNTTCYMYACRGGYQLMPEWGTRPANHYLPHRKTRITIHEDELIRVDNPLKKERQLPMPDSDERRWTMSRRGKSSMSPVTVTAEGGASGFA